MNLKNIIHQKVSLFLLPELCLLQETINRRLPLSCL